MTQLQARNIFNEVHAPRCAYHYAEEAAKNLKDPEPADSASLADCMINSMADAVLSVQYSDDKTGSIHKLYDLVALALKTIDCLEGRLTNED